MHRPGEFRQAIHDCDDRPGRFGAKINNPDRNRQLQYFQLAQTPESLSGVLIVAL